MGNGLKVFVALGAIAAGAAAIFALKKRKELEDYDYEELDDDFDDCCCDCDDCTSEEETPVETTEATDDVEADLNNIEDSVEDIDQ